MRNISQYKILLRTRDYYRTFTKKILTLKHAKWFSIQKFLKRKLIQEKKTQWRLQKIRKRKLKEWKKLDNLKKQKKFKELREIAKLNRLKEVQRIARILELKKQKIFVKKKPSFVNFIDFEKLAVEKKRLVQKITHYRLRRKVHFILGQMYDQSLNKKELALFLKKENLKNRNYIFKKLFLRMECRLDIFLWRLKFFNNIYECRKALDKHEILVNGRFLGWNTFLQKGDIIEVNSIFNAKAIRSKTFSLSFFNSFIETDYYTGNVVILKDLKELNLNDLSLFVPKRLNLDQIYKSILW